MGGLEAARNEDVAPNASSSLDPPPTNPCPPTSTSPHLHLPLPAPTSRLCLHVASARRIFPFPCTARCSLRHRSFLASSRYLSLPPPLHFLDPPTPSVRSCSRHPRLHDSAAALPSPPFPASFPRTGLLPPPPADVPRPPPVGVRQLHPGPPGALPLPPRRRPPAPPWACRRPRLCHARHPPLSPRPRTRLRPFPPRLALSAPLRAPKGRPPQRPVLGRQPPGWGRHARSARVLAHPSLPDRRGRPRSSPSPSHIDHPSVPCSPSGAPLASPWRAHRRARRLPFRAPNAPRPPPPLPIP